MYSSVYIIVHVVREIQCVMKSSTLQCDIHLMHIQTENATALCTLLLLLQLLLCESKVKRAHTWFATLKKKHETQLVVAAMKMQLLLLLVLYLLRL
jgi:hypothetical protein